MSDLQRKHYRIGSAVFKEAWALKKRTILFSLHIRTALKLAWRTVRSLLFMHHSKVYGTTFDGRQVVLKRLAQYPEKDIILKFEREPDNQFDSNAIKIIAHVKSKGSAAIGYVSKNIAANVAPMIDAGFIPIVLFAGITGSAGSGYLGCNFKYCLIEK
jgi:hypothetical protein